MKKALLILLSVMGLSTVSAQYYYIPYTNAGKNPGGLNTDAEYPVGGGISPGWTTLLAGNQTSPAWSSQTTLPFTFKFNGNDYTKFYVSSSGVLTFSSTVGTAPAYANTNLPDASIPDNSACIRGILSAGANSAYANIVTKTFGTTGSRQFWITFSAYNEANLGSSAYLWVSIVLEEGSNAIYFVDQRKAPATATKLTMGVQVNSSTYAVVAGSPNVNLTATSSATVSDNSYYKFLPGTQPSFNTEAFANTVPDFLALTKAPFTISGKFKNIGSSSITSCDINYSINNGTPVTSSATVSIANNAVATVSSNSTWNPGVIGTYSLKVWLSNLDGNNDGQPSNDTISKTVTVLEDFVQRVPLHEVFTSSTCGPCNPGNVNIDNNIFPKYASEEYAVIKYQMSWPGTGDPYTTAEGNTRRTLYGVNSIPNMQVDGGWNSNAGNYTVSLMDQFKSKPSYIKIEATHTINFKKVVMDVKITPLADYNNANMKLFVAILEKKTTKNVKSNGETEFHHVLKKMMPDASGTAIGALTKNTPKTFPTMTWIVPGNVRLPIDGQAANIINLATENSIEELQDCEVVVFVQDLSTKEVYQAANSVGTVLSVDDKNVEASGISVFPNPSKGELTQVAFNLSAANQVTVSVFNALGKLVETINTTDLEAGKHVLSFNTADYNSGIYTVKVQGNGFSAAEKFIVE